MNNFIKFLKPNKKKIILFLLLLHLISTLANHAFFNLPQPTEEPLSQGESLPIPNWTGCSEVKTNSLLWLPISIFTAVKNEPFISCGYNQAMLFVLPYWIVMSYFISCFIFYLYEKFKPKKL